MTLNIKKYRQPDVTFITTQVGDITKMDDDVIMFAPKNEGYCLHFESPGFAQTMNDMFDYMWKKGEWVN